MMRTTLQDSAMRRRLALLLLLLLPLTALAAPAAGDAEKSTGSDPYVALEPFVLNVQDAGRIRFMQVKVQLLAGDPKVREILKEHIPPIRDAMIMLLAHQNAETVQTMEGRETLRAQALAAVQEVFARVTNADPKAPAPEKPPIEALYFTDFIIQ
jgi:flagellar FliL protein